MAQAANGSRRKEKLFVFREGITGCLIESVNYTYLVFKGIVEDIRTRDFRPFELTISSYDLAANTNLRDAIGELYSSSVKLIMDGVVKEEED